MSKWDISFGGSGAGTEQNDQIDSTKKTTSSFGGEPAKEKKVVSTSGLNASVMKKKPVMVMGGTTDGEEDTMGLIPTAQANPSKFKEVEIKAG
jgi:hypothetical protein